MTGAKRTLLLASALAIFLAALLLSWVFHGTGVVRNDAARNIYIPPELTMPLQVKAAFNGEKIFSAIAGRRASRTSTTTC